MRGASSHAGTTTTTRDALHMVWRYSRMRHWPLLLLAAAVFAAIWVGTYAIGHRPFPAETTPEGAYARVALSVEERRYKDIFPYLETEAQWAAYTIRDTRKKACRTVRASYVAGERERLLAEWREDAEARSTERTFFAIVARQRVGGGWRVSSETSPVARRASTSKESVRHGRHRAGHPVPVSTTRTMGSGGLTMFTAVELQADAERASRDLEEVVQRAADDYDARRGPLRAAGRRREASGQGRAGRPARRRGTAAARRGSAASGRGSRGGSRCETRSETSPGPGRQALRRRAPPRRLAGPRASTTTMFDSTASASDITPGQLAEDLGDAPRAPVVFGETRAVALERVQARPRPGCRSGACRRRASCGIAGRARRADATRRARTPRARPGPSRSTRSPCRTARPDRPRSTRRRPPRSRAARRRGGPGAGAASPLRPRRPRRAAGRRARPRDCACSRRRRATSGAASRAAHAPSARTSWAPNNPPLPAVANWTPLPGRRRRRPTRCSRCANAFADDDLVPALRVEQERDLVASIVPLGTKSAASLPREPATRSSSARVVGSSRNTSSPTSADAIAARDRGRRAASPCPSGGRTGPVPSIAVSPPCAFMSSQDRPLG